MFRVCVIYYAVYGGILRLCAVCVCVHVTWASAETLQEAIEEIACKEKWVIFSHSD